MYGCYSLRTVRAATVGEEMIFERRQRQQRHSDLHSLPAGDGFSRLPPFMYQLRRALRADGW